MIEHYTSLCVYREELIEDGSMQKFFDPISDIESDKLFDISQMRDMYGLRCSRLFLVYKANVQLKDGLFYKVEWTVKPIEERPKGYQELISCSISTAPTIIEINSDYAPMIQKGDVGTCLEHYKKISNKPIYLANYIFAAPTVNSSRFSGLLLKFSELDNQTQTLNSNVFVTNRVELSARDLFRHGEFTLYNQMELPPTCETIFIKNPIEVIANELKRCATWAKVRNLTTHSYHTEFRNILQAIAHGGFYENLSMQLGMPEDEIKKYEELIKSQFFALLSSENQFAKDIDSYVMGDETIKNVLLDRLRQQLIAEHPNVRQDILSLEDKKVTLQNEVNALQEEISNNEIKVEELRSEADTYENLIKKSEEKFTAIQTDISSFLSSIPFVQKMIEPKIEVNEEKNEVKNTVQKASKYIVEEGALVESEDRCEVLSNLDDLSEILKDNLESIGAAKNLTASMATLLISSLIPSSKPLLIFGAGARTVADCLSASLFNRRSNYLYLENDATYQDAINALTKFKSNGMVLVDNVLLKPYFWQLVETQKIKNNKVIYSANLPEELKLLPKSAFKYVKPLLTDFYIENCESTELFGARIDITNLFTKKMDGETPAWFKRLALPKAIQIDVKKELGLAETFKFEPKQVNTYLFHSTVLPWYTLEDDVEELSSVVQDVDFVLNKQEMINLIENKML